MADRYRDRQHAGEVLAEMLAHHRGNERLIVLGLPRGGVPVASVVARSLEAPLDVVVVRKVGTPGQAELAMGAIASIAGTVVTVKNPDVLGMLGGPDRDETFEAAAAVQREELRRRELTYREGRPPLDVDGQTVILVDDGLATGATMRAAIGALEPAGAAAVVVAVPIGPRDTCTELEALVDEVVCAWIPEGFWAVGQGYVDFTQTSDDEVRALLAGP